MSYFITTLAQIANGTDPNGAGTGNPISEISEKMGITGPQLVSQIILFGLVLWFLKRFAFGPVQKVLGERKKLIDQSLENSEKIRLELTATEASRKEILKKADTRAAEIIVEAQAAAESLAKRREEEATKEAEQIISRAHEATKIERDRIEVELRREFTRLVAEATQRAVGKILTPEDHQRLNAETVTQASRN